MALTLVTGRPNAGKSGHLYGPVIESVSAGHSPVVALPSTPDARRAADEFAARGITGVRTVVLDKWIAELWSLHGDGRQLVEGAMREVLVRRACSATDLAALVETAGLPGFTHLIAAICQHAPDLNEISAHSPEDRDVLAVLASYERLLAAEGLVEPAAAALALGKAPLICGGAVAVNRFTDLSPAQEAFLCGLAAHTDVYLALPWEERHPATEALTALVWRLGAAGEHVHVEQPETDSALQQFEESLFRGEQPLEPSGSVVFGETAGVELEVVLALDWAAECIEEGVAPERIAVLFRDAASRVELVRAAARQVGLEVDIDVAIPLAHTQMGRAFLALLDAAAGRDLTRERLMGFLASPYSTVGSDALEEIDVRWRRKRVSGVQLLEDARRSAGGSKAIDTAREVTRTTLTAKSAAFWKHLVDAMLVAADGRRGLEHEAGRWDCAVHRTVLGVVSGLAGMREGVSESEVRSALARATVSPGGAEGAGAVVFTEAHRARSRRFDVVILGGLTAEEFSAHRSRSAGAEWLERLGLAAGPDERATERLLFYTLATRPRKRLYLLRASSDATGQALTPSVFWEEAIDVYRTPAEVEAGIHPDTAPLIRLGQSSFARNALAYAHGSRARRQHATEAPARQRQRRLSSPRVMDALASREEYAVSELEAYASCPYRWFFERAIRPRDVDTAFEAREAGTLAHDALAAFYERWSAENGASRITPDALEEARVVAQQVLDGVFVRAPDTIGLAEELTSAKVRAWVTGAIEDDATLLQGYAPIAHELSFGQAEGRPFEFGGVLLRGRIDRVDASGQGLVVTDYKSAASVAGHRSFATQGIFQLPVYLAAAAAVLEYEPHGAVFRSLRSRTARGFWRDDYISLEAFGSKSDAVTEAQVAEILADAEERVARAVEGIRAGDIQPCRGGCSACRGCSARTICGEASEQ